MQYIIIGNGIAGLTAARYLRKLDEGSSIKLIGEEVPYPFSRPGLMYINTDRLLPEDLELYERWFYQKNRIDLINDSVMSVNAQNKKVTLKKGDELSYDKLLLATGSYPRMFNWKNRELEGICTYNSMQDALLLQENAKKSKSVVVVGGGLTGLEVVECLSIQGIKVTFLVREAWYFDRALIQEEAELIHKRLKKLNVDLRLEEEIDEFIGEGSVKAVKTNKGNTIDCDLVYITIGVVSQTELAAKANIATERGILVDEYQRTNVEDVYAAGDCAEIPAIDGQTIVELLWYTARDQGKTAAYNMAGIKTPYEKPIFYNAARFLDIDYMTVGKTMELKEDEKNYLVTHPKKNISIRIVYKNKKVLGFNMLGLKWNIEILISFVQHNNNLDQVKRKLKKALFNPEFTPNYLKEMIDAL